MKRSQPHAKGKQVPTRRKRESSRGEAGEECISIRDMLVYHAITQLCVQMKKFRQIFTTKLPTDPLTAISL